MRHALNHVIITIPSFFFQSRSDGYFTFREIDRRTVALILQQSLEDLVDQSAPVSALQFRLSCRGRSGVSIQNQP